MSSIDGPFYVQLSDTIPSMEQCTQLVALPTCEAISSLASTTVHQKKQKNVTSIQFEAVLPAAEQALLELCHEATMEYPTVGRIAIFHVLGESIVGKINKIICVSSSSWQEASSCVQFIMDELNQQRVPIWKKEINSSSSSSNKNNNKRAIHPQQLSPRKRVRAMHKKYHQPRHYDYNEINKPKVVGVDLKHDQNVEDEISEWREPQEVETKHKDETNGGSSQSNQNQKQKEGEIDDNERFLRRQHAQTHKMHQERVGGCHFPKFVTNSQCSSRDDAGMTDEPANEIKQPTSVEATEKTLKSQNVIASSNRQHYANNYSPTRAPPPPSTFGMFTNREKGLRGILPPAAASKSQHGAAIPIPAIQSKEQAILAQARLNLEATTAIGGSLHRDLILSQNMTAMHPMRMLDLIRMSQNPPGTPMLGNLQNLTSHHGHYPQPYQNRMDMCGQTYPNIAAAAAKMLNGARIQAMNENAALHHHVTEAEAPPRTEKESATEGNGLTLSQKGAPQHQQRTKSDATRSTLSSVHIPSSSSVHVPPIRNKSSTRTTVKGSDDITSGDPSKPTPAKRVRDKSVIILPDEYVPTNDDVVCACGNISTCHPGNIRFRAIVDSKLSDYQKAETKVEKGNMFSFIVKLIRKNGKFVRPHKSGWCEINDGLAREKVAMTFRSALSSHTARLNNNQEKDMISHLIEQKLAESNNVSKILTSSLSSNIIDKERINNNTEAQEESEKVRAPSKPNPSSESETSPVNTPKDARQAEGKAANHVSSLMDHQAVFPAVTGSLVVKRSIATEGNQTRSCGAGDRARASSAKGRDCVGRGLPADYVPTEFDVICARGKSSLCHPGNIRFKGIIKSRLPDFMKAQSKSEKAILYTSVKDLMRKDGMFVRQDKNSGRWHEVTESYVHEKVGQTFRDVLCSVTVMVENEAKEKNAMPYVMQQTVVAKQTAMSDSSWMHGKAPQENRTILDMRNFVNKEGFRNLEVQEPVVQTRLSNNETKPSPLSSLEALAEQASKVSNSLPNSLLSSNDARASKPLTSSSTIPRSIGGNVAARAKQEMPSRYLPAGFDMQRGAALVLSE